MITSVKDITVEFICSNCARKRTLYLGMDIDLDTLSKRIMNRTCSSCGKTSVDISRLRFYYHSGDSIVGRNR